MPSDPTTAGGGAEGLAALLMDKSRSMNRFETRELLVAAAEALARTSAERDRIEVAVRAALDDACRMETIWLKVGELSPQEQQLASIVAGTVKGTVLSALKREQGVDDAQ